MSAPRTANRDHRRHRSQRRVVVASVAATVVGLGGIGYASQAGSAPAATATVQQPSRAQQPSYGTFGPQTGQPSTPGSTSSAATDATSAQEVGLVYVNTTLDYGTARAAGTGIVLTSDGEVLTNHHVVEGATTISVEVVSTGQTYDADVVGYDATHDVAVLQLAGASGLTPVTTGAAGTVAVGDEVTGVGNANGDGGAASASAGTVVALEQAINVSDESDDSTNRLTGLIEVDADIISGDSGGALYDADGKVVGMNTAASSGAADITGYAVPIAQALSIAAQIESGAASGDVVVGGHGYLGVQLAPDVTGALVAGVVDGSPAAAAGLGAGSTITSLNGRATTSADTLSQAVAVLPFGDRATVTWTDSSGAAQSATLTLADGPVG